jgi:hypothetical protein
MSDPGGNETTRLALIAGSDALAAARLNLAELTDSDARAVAIHADHPEFSEALERGHDSATVAGAAVNVRMHLAMHEIVANQLAENDPPEVAQTGERLLAAGYDRHEVIHMLASTVVEQLHSTMIGAGSYDRASHVAALAALPASWEKVRSETSSGRQERNTHPRFTRRRRR